MIIDGANLYILGGIPRNLETLNFNDHIGSGSIAENIACQVCHCNKIVRYMLGLCEAVDICKKVLNFISSAITD